MSNRYAAMLALCATLAASVASAASAAGNPPAVGPLGVGKRLALPQLVVAALRREHRSADVYLIATRDGQNFYRLGDSGRCYGSGPSAKLNDAAAFHDPAAALGDAVCYRGRSPIPPVVDLSTWGASASAPVPHLLRLVGIAASAVRTIQLLNRQGSVVGSVQVTHNVFVARRPLAAVTGLRAEDSRGRVLWQAGR